MVAGLRVEITSHDHEVESLVNAIRVKIGERGDVALASSVD